MNVYYAHRLVSISDCLTSIRLKSFSSGNNGMVLNDESKARIKAALEKIVREVEFMGLRMTKLGAERFLNDINSITEEEAWGKVASLEERFNDELESIILFFISQDKLTYYQKPDQFGSEVASKFRNANHEASEAGKCFATARYTATVFHLMRVLEIALKTLARGLGIPDPTKDYERNWGKMLKKIKDEIDSRNSGSSPGLAWSHEKDFFEKAYAYFEGARNPWRNATMHVETNYDEQGALDIYNTTSSLMRHLAKNLAE